MPRIWRSCATAERTVFPRVMWLVLCESWDTPALWAYAGLRDRGLRPLVLLSPQALVAAPRSLHRVGRNGGKFEFTLADGRSIDGDEIRGVLNRLCRVPLDHLRLAPAADAQYAAEEIHAWMLSWMACLDPVTINRASPLGLAGADHAALEWTALAARAGLATQPIRFPGPAADSAGQPPSTVIVFDRGVHGATLPATVAAGCAKLARMTGNRLLGITFDRRRGEDWLFAGATSMP